MFQNGVSANRNVISVCVCVCMCVRIFSAGYLEFGKRKNKMKTTVFSGMPDLRHMKLLKKKSSKNHPKIGKTHVFSRI